jgi:GNAT superfamily N-acetyltransferase
MPLMNATLRPADGEDASAVANVLISSRLAYMPFAPSAHSPEEVLAWVGTHLIPDCETTVATIEDEIVGVLAVSQRSDAAWINQLFVLPGWVGRGIGSQLLRHAHAKLSRPIRLYTFQAHSRARRFYERHGYKAIGFTDGQANEERCPDVLYELSAGASEA